MYRREMEGGLYPPEGPSPIHGLMRTSDIMYGERGSTFLRIGVGGILPVCCYAHLTLSLKQVILRICSTEKAVDA